MSKLPSSGGSWEARKSGAPKQVEPPTRPAPIASPAQKAPATPAGKAPTPASGKPDTPQKEG